MTDVDLPNSKKERNDLMCRSRTRNRLFYSWNMPYPLLSRPKNWKRPRKSNNKALIIAYIDIVLSKFYLDKIYMVNTLIKETTSSNREPKAKLTPMRKNSIKIWPSQLSSPWLRQGQILYTTLHNNLANSIWKCWKPSCNISNALKSGKSCMVVRKSF